MAGVTVGTERSVEQHPEVGSWYSRHPMLTATVLGVVAGAAVAALDLTTGPAGRDWRGSMVLPAGLITVSVLLTLVRVRRSGRLSADRAGLVLAAVIGVALVAIGVSVIPGSTTVPRVLNGGLTTLLGLVLAGVAGAAAARPAVPAVDAREGTLDWSGGSPDGSPAGDRRPGGSGPARPGEGD